MLEMVHAPTYFDAAEIMFIPICVDGEDFIAWHFDSKGMFLVKSAYRVYLMIYDGTVLSSGGNSWEHEA